MVMNIDIIRVFFFEKFTFLKFIKKGKMTITKLPMQA